jgi:hypothetical protein
MGALSGLAPINPHDTDDTDERRGEATPQLAAINMQQLAASERNGREN